MSGWPHGGHDRPGDQVPPPNATTSWVLRPTLSDSQPKTGWAIMNAIRVTALISVACPWRICGVGQKLLHVLVYT